MQLQSANITCVNTRVLEIAAGVGQSGIVLHHIQDEDSLMSCQGCK